MITRQLTLVALSLVAALTFGCRSQASTPPSDAEDSPKATIHVTVAGIREPEGNLRAALFHDAMAFPKKRDKAFRTTTVPATGETVTITFDDVPYHGAYAVSVLHDENANNKLDIGSFGPAEGIGASRDATGFLGPPEFEDASFPVDAPEVELTIHMKY